jgi:hypothetical protein
MYTCVSVHESLPLPNLRGNDLNAYSLIQHKADPPMYVHVGGSALRTEVELPIWYVHAGLTLQQLLKVSPFPFSSAIL